MFITSGLLALVQTFHVMKNLYLAGMGLLLATATTAQQKEGKVTFERSVQMTMSFSQNGGPAESQTQTRTNRFELNFANNQMMWRQLEDEMQDDNMNSGGMIVRTIGGGADDATFCDFNAAKKVEQREFFDKKFLITDSIRRGTWKVSEETRTILNHLCRKATSQRIGKRQMMTMENGQMVRKEVEDTSQIVAWFTMDIPVPAGPEMQGQLPGLILEMETNNGRTTYRALEISPRADVSTIKEPGKGKKVTPEEFAKERNKMLEEMQRNNGGNFRIRTN